MTTDPATTEAAAPSPASLAIRWDLLDDEQRQQVLDYLAQRQGAVFAAALDFEERTRPDED